MTRKTITSIINAVLILLFVYAATSKLLNYGLFRFQLSKSPYLADFAGTISWLLPFTELAVVFLLITVRLRKAGLYASLILMLLFTGYIFAILNYAEHIPCSCGGVLSHLSWSQHMIFNVLIILLIIAAILLDPAETNEHPLPTRLFS